MVYLSVDRPSEGFLDRLHAVADRTRVPEVRVYTGAGCLHPSYLASVERLMVRESATCRNETKEKPPRDGKEVTNKVERKGALGERTKTGAKAQVISATTRSSMDEEREEGNVDDEDDDDDDDDDDDNDETEEGTEDEQEEEEKEDEEEKGRGQDENFEDNCNDDKEGREDEEEERSKKVTSASASENQNDGNDIYSYQDNRFLPNHRKRKRLIAQLVGPPGSKRMNSRTGIQKGPLTNKAEDADVDDEEDIMEDIEALGFLRDKGTRPNRVGARTLFPNLQPGLVRRKKSYYGCNKVSGQDPQDHLSSWRSSTILDRNPKLRAKESFKVGVFW